MGYNWEKGFIVDFDKATGLSASAKSTKRMLSQMRGMYANDAAQETMIRAGDPVVYEFFELGAPEDPGDIAPGISIVYPGKVGGEYFMTKGHFHTIIDTAEAYYTLSGSGYMLAESPEGDCQAFELTPGRMVYVPRRYAHRSVNIGNTPLVTFFAFRADAGHDYGTIEQKGFRQLIVERGGRPEVVDNPKWK